MTRSKFDRKYTSQLNPQQLAAVHAVDGAVLLLAVPGSGKTTVLVTRLGYMLCCCGISPDAILTMTYTKAATKEMQKRFVRLFGQDCPQIPEIRTINGVSSKIIDFYTRTHGSGSAFTVVENEGELAKIVSDLYRELSGEFATQSVIKELRKGIAYVKNMMLGKEDLGELDTGFDQFPELYVQYNLPLRQRRWMDYDDQMIYAKTILENYPDILAHFQDAFPYICVDEAQDTSKIQHAIIQLLARKTGNLFMVGDEDQSIYGFRAAYPDALMQFEQTYPKARVLLMEENYRSTPEILRLANGFIRKNTDRRPKTVRPTRVSGANVHLISAADRTAQYAWLLNVAAHCDGQTAILCRSIRSISGRAFPSGADRWMTPFSPIGWWRIFWTSSPLPMTGGTRRHFPASTIKSAAASPKRLRNMPVKPVSAPGKRFWRSCSPSPLSPSTPGTALPD